MPDPVQTEYADKMNAVASILDEIFNGPPEQIAKEGRKVGFVLLLSEFGKAEGGRVNYISNGERSDMQKMMVEVLQRQTGEGVNVLGTLFPEKSTLLPGLPRGKPRT